MGHKLDSLNTAIANIGSSNGDANVDATLALNEKKAKDDKADKEEKKKDQRERATTEAREIISNKIRDIVETCESELTFRALRDLNIQLAANPRDMKNIFRKMLIAYIGNVEGVLKYFDRNASGDISFSEFHEGIMKLWKTEDIEYFKTLTGVQKVNWRKLFKMFDDSQDGCIDTVELLGIKTEDFDA